LEGHFILTSGRHANLYFEKAEIAADPTVTDYFCWQLAHKARSQLKIPIEVVVGLGRFGPLWANRLAFHLSEFYQESVLAVSTEKDEESKKMVLKRGDAGKVPGKDVLIVDDILTTGRSVGEAKSLVEKCGGKAIAVVVFCKRGEVRFEAFGDTPVLALWEIEIPDYEPGKGCPYCVKGVLLVDPKSR